MKCLILFLFLFYGHAVEAQSYDGTVKYKNRQQPAAILEVAYPTDVVMAAVTSYLSKRIKSAETHIKGFATFRNSQMPDTGENADLYFKIDRKSSREKETTIISLLLTHPKLNQVPPDTLYYLNMEEAKVYLNDLALIINAYDLRKKIKVLQDEIYFAEAVYANIEDDVGKCEGEKKILNDKFLVNTKAFQSKKAEIESLKRALEILKKNAE